MGTLAGLNPTEPEEKIIKAALVGEVASFEISAAENERKVRAKIIYMLAIESDKEGGPVHAKGIRIKNAVIVDRLDFEAAEIKKPIELLHCKIRDPITLRYAQTHSVNFDGSTVPKIDAEGLKVDGSLYFGRGFTCGGEIVLRGAEVEGDLDARSAMLGTGPNKSDSNLHDSSSNAVLDADGICVEGTLYIGAGLRAFGEVRMRGAEIKGDLDAAGGTFCNKGGIAIDADGLSVEDDILFGWSEKTAADEQNHPFSAQGQIKLEGAQIGGSLDCSGGGFSNVEGESTLVANGVRINGDFNASAYTGTKHPLNFISKGAVQLGGARIQGTFNGSGGIFSFVPVAGISPSRDEQINGAAIYADGIRVDGDIELHNSKINGTLRLRGGTVEGDIYCNAASIDALTDKFGVWEKKFEKREPDNEGLSNLAKAINADGLDVKGDIFLTNSFSSRGQVRLRSAKIGGDLDCSEKCKFTNNFGTAFRIQGAQVAGRLTWKDHDAQPMGDIDLRYANVGRYEDDQASWPEIGCLLIDGFTYGALVDEEQTKSQNRLRWLGLQPLGSYAPQPYEQLTKVLRSMGHADAANDIAFAKRKMLTRQPSNSIWWKSSQIILERTVGYGYRLKRVWFLIFGFLFIGAVIFYLASASLNIRPAKERIFLESECYIVSVDVSGCDNDSWVKYETSFRLTFKMYDLEFILYPLPQESPFRTPEDYPKFNALSYSIDVFFPLFDLHQESFWLPVAWFRVYMWIHILVGWVLATVFVIGLSEFMRRE